MANNNSSSSSARNGMFLGGIILLLVVLLVSMGVAVNNVFSETTTKDPGTTRQPLTPEDAGTGVSNPDVGDQGAYAPAQQSTESPETLIVVCDLENLYKIQIASSQFTPEKYSYDLTPCQPAKQ